METDYLGWLSSQTSTEWWVDTGKLSEIDHGMSHGALGVTTNPVLTHQALVMSAREWESDIAEILNEQSGVAKAESLTGLVVKSVSEKLYPVYKRTGGESGYVCSQVNPASAQDREVMYKSAKRMADFAENVSVKLPATAAGLDVMQECVASGINVTMTVSFTVPQVLEIASRYQAARNRAKDSGVMPGRCNAVLMIGRIDDYLRDAAQDMNAGIEESDIICAGLAIAKRAYSIYKEKKYDAVLMVAAMRGSYHITELAGAEMILSIAPAYQKMMTEKFFSHAEGIENPVNDQSVKRLKKMKEFVKAYEPDGMDPSDFFSFGAEQRTLTQFSCMGWNMLENFRL